MISIRERLGESRKREQERPSICSHNDPSYPIDPYRPTGRLRVSIWRTRSVKRAKGVMSTGQWFDAGTDKITPRQYFMEGSYYIHRLRVKFLVVILRFAKATPDKMDKTRELMNELQKRKKLFIDWTGAVRKSGVCVIIKTRALDYKGQTRNFFLLKDDIQYVKGVVESYD